MRAFVNVAASQTDSVVVAAVTGKIVVYAMFCMAGGTATTLTFNTKGAGAGVAISPLFSNGANGGAVLSSLGSDTADLASDGGWFETSVSEGLTVTTGAGSATGIIVLYALV